MKEIVVDNFAGGGGASTGIAMALGRSVDIAINHDPVEACNGRPVALAWFSSDCKNFSKAKGAMWW